MWVRTPRSGVNLGFQGPSQLWERADLSAMVLSALAHSFLQKHTLKTMSRFLLLNTFIYKNLSYEVVWTTVFSE